jgi:hypothetical protein
MIALVSDPWTRPEPVPAPEGRGGLALHRRQDVRADLERHRHPRVAEAITDNVDRLLGGEQERRARMPQAVERDRLHAGGLDQGGELALPEVVDLQRVAGAMRFGAAV